LFTDGRKTRAGFPTEPQACGALDVSDEERERHLEKIWSRGGFNFLMGNYSDLLVNKEANKKIYDFWAKKVRARIRDPKKRELMAPTEPPYYLGTKRAPLEQDYYEMIDQDNVDIVNLNETPFKEFNEKGILLEDGQQLDFDVVVLATGFDSFSGS
jgi:cation diffusion facilitator CzcD-associated flavoprotein CzcO